MIIIGTNIMSGRLLAVRKISALAIFSFLLNGPVFADGLQCMDKSQTPDHLCIDGAEADSSGGVSAARETDTASSARLLQTKSARMRNQTAADLQKSWNGTSGVARGLGVKPLTAKQARKAKKRFKHLRAAHLDPNGSKAVLRNVPLESLTLLGQRDGMTFAAWKGGPAGTMPIRFHFGPHETASANGFTKHEGGASGDFRSVLRRSAKIWSRRLVDTGKRRDVTLEDGTTYRGVRGLVLQVHLRDRGAVTGGVRKYEHGPTGKDFIVYYGAIGITRHVHDNLHDGMPSTVAHEIGHALGIVSTTANFYLDTYYHAGSHTWRGPNAMRAYGGKPVPMQWRSEDQWWVVKEPHAPGSERDRGHLGVCTSLMAYCRDDYDGGMPAELDYAFLADIGYELVDAKVAAETERYGYAAWGDWAVWGASVERDLQDNLHEFPHDFTQAHADAFGTRPAIPLADNTELPASGKAVWNGSLVGVDLGRKRLPPVTGDAELQVDLGTLDGTVQFSNLRVHLGNIREKTRANPFRQTRLSYEIDVTGNNFGDTAGKVTGGFFGPAHQEMAGVVNDTRPEVNLLGGFGGIRDGE